jgi:hypothetical protein
MSRLEDRTGCHRDGQASRLVMQTAFLIVRDKGDAIASV